MTFIRVGQRAILMISLISYLWYRDFGNKFLAVILNLPFLPSVSEPLADEQKRDNSETGLGMKVGSYGWWLEKMKKNAFRLTITGIQQLAKANGQAHYGKYRLK